ncbi:MAG: hypothetical protein GC134_06245 [Proteobacteria bacterium]|nr:hypothetical protein [Pseudomonadota bacterium]
MYQLPQPYRAFLQSRADAHMAFARYVGGLIQHRHSVNPSNPVTITVGTHAETFHADELMACVVLKRFMSMVSTEVGVTVNVEIQRLNRENQAALDAADILVDVGREYDPARGRFDHHQNFDEGMTPRRYNERGQPDVELSAIGMVWHACGLFVTGEAVTNVPTDRELDILRMKARSDALAIGPCDVRRVMDQAVRDVLRREAYDHIDWSFVRGFDASDNGYVMSRAPREKRFVRLLQENIGLLKTAVTKAAILLSGQLLTVLSDVERELPGEQTYYGQLSHPSKLIGNANGRDIGDDAEQYRRFMQQVDIWTLMFSNTLEEACRIRDDRQKLQEAVDSQRGGDNPQVLVLAEYLRWTDHINSINRADHIRVVITPISDKGHWNIRARNNRDNAPAAWRGHQGDELVAISGIADMVFCHGHGHMVRTRSLESAIEVAKLMMTSNNA